MATKTKSVGISIVQYRKKNKKNNKGIHAKRKASKNKQSKNYVKRSVGQG